MNIFNKLNDVVFYLFTNFFLFVLFFKFKKEKIYRNSCRFACIIRGTLFVEY